MSAPEGERGNKSFFSLFPKRGGGGGERGRGGRGGTGPRGGGSGGGRGEIEGGGNVPAIVKEMKSDSNRSESDSGNRGSSAGEGGR